MHTDPIADMLTRIRNAQAVRKTVVILPFSKFKLSLANLLAREGFIAGVEQTAAPDKPNFSTLKLTLKYSRSGKPAMTSIKKVSKPGRKIYADADSLPRVLNGLGIAVISTSRGLLTNKEARRARVGGEVLCEVY